MAHLEMDVDSEEHNRALLLAGATIYRDLKAAALVEHALARGEGSLAHNGALVVRTGRFTGRSPGDKYIVQEPSSTAEIWWGKVNQPLSESSFERLHRRVVDYLRGRDLYQQSLFGGADARFRLPVRIVTEYAWHSLFARQLLVRPPDPPDRASTASPGSVESGEAVESVLHESEEGFTILAAPGCQATPSQDGTKSETFIVIHPGRRLVLIGGTEYAGEIKKSVFTILNYLLPRQGVLPMHCSANVGREHGDTALFFGLSGTGKTTLSADPRRELIGDDEHGWSDAGIFNFEGGCYAKCIHLNAEAEPQIWSAIRFGAVLENVVLDPETRELAFDSNRYTENTRAAYPVEFIPGARIPGVGGHPRNILFLTADAFGVLPPISRLTIPQARFHFLSGYTAKVAGTERGVTEPQVTFSSCFGQPFLPLRPVVYARLLGEKLLRHQSTVWLVNTGWTGGPYGTGRRMSIQHTRAMIDAALSGALDSVPYREDPVFGLAVPTAAPGVPQEVLDPRGTWQNRSAYDAQASDLARRFVENFALYRADASSDVIAAAPRV